MFFILRFLNLVGIFWVFCVSSICGDRMNGVLILLDIGINGFEFIIVMIFVIKVVNILCVSFLCLVFISIVLRM